MGQAHISIVGRFDPEYAAHVATREAIIHAEAAMGEVLNTRWIDPNHMEDAAEALSGSCGALIAPRIPRRPGSFGPRFFRRCNGSAPRTFPPSPLSMAINTW